MGAWKSAAALKVRPGETAGIAGSEGPHALLDPGFIKGCANRAFEPNEDLLFATPGVAEGVVVTWC